MKKIKLKLTGGKYNNRIIVSYNPNTKTTASIVRGAVFNMLNNYNGIVLDLFAGSGSFGFEAISRGFDEVYFNDFNSLSIKAIKENIKTLDCHNSCHVTKLDYKDALNFYESKNIKFDLYFIDPPYDMDDNQILEILNLITQYNNKTTIVVERKKNSPSFNIIGLSLIKNKTYGTRQIQIYEKI